MKDFINEIKRKSSWGWHNTHFCSKWDNGKIGAIVLDKDGFVVFEEYTEDMMHIAIDDNGKAKEPVKLTNVRNGFVHWLLLSIQSNDVNFETFYNACKEYFVSQHKNDSDSWKWKENTDEYFANIHHSAMQKQLVDIPLYNYLNEKDSGLIRSYCNNYLEWLQHKLPNIKEKPLKNSIQIISKLQTDKAKEMFTKAEDFGLIEKLNDGKLKWKGTKTLCAYFAYRATEYLDLSNTALTNGKMAAVFKPFEEIFGFTSLKTCKADWDKCKFGKPRNYNQIDNLFDKLYEGDN